MSGTSFGTSLRAFTLLGGGQVINLLSNVIKMKVVASFLGPAGVGLIGIYSNLMSMAGALAAFGSGIGSTRQVSTALANGSDSDVGRLRRSIFWMTSVLAVFGGVVFLLLSGPIARLVLGNDQHVSEVAWLSAGVAFTVIIVSQSAILAGLRRVGDLARVDVVTGVLGAALGIAAVLVLKDRAPVAVVLIPPAITLLVSYFLIARLGRPELPPLRYSDIASDVGPILRMGVYACYWGALFQAGFLVVRAVIQRNIGYDASGLFQAAWAMSLAYHSFLLASVASDFFPRLTGVIKDRAAAVKLINEQTEVLLLISVPLALGLLGFAPWVIKLLYTAQFLPAADLLRWLILGDALKIAYFPLGYTLIALGSIRLFAANQTLAVAAYIVCSLIGIGHLGLVAAGIAYLLMWAVFIPIPWWSAHLQLGFHWTAPVIRQTALAICSLSLVAIVGSASDLAGAVLGGTLSVLTGVWALIRISHAGDIGRLNGLAAVTTKWSGRLRRRR